MSLERIRFSAPLRGVVVDGRSVAVRESQITVPVPAAPVAVAPRIEEPVAPPEPILPTEAIEAVTASLAQVHELVIEFERRRQQSLRELQQLAVELSFAVAEKLLRQKIDAGEFPIEELIDELLSKAGVDGPMTAYLHPDDYALMQKIAAERGPPDALSSLRFEVDATLDRGGCRLVTDQADIVSNLGQELEEFRIHVLLGLEDVEIERRKTERSSDGLRRDAERRNAP